MLACPQIHCRVGAPGRQASAVSRSRDADVSPDALSKPRSPAGNASGQRSARMAMYCAVQSPIPGSSCKAWVTPSGSGPGCRSICRRVTTRATVRMLPARAALIPSALSSDSAASASRAGDGLRRFKPGERCFDRLAEATRKPPGECRRGSNRDALAQDRPHDQLEAVERPGHAQTRATIRRRSPVGHRSRGETR